MSVQFSKYSMKGTITLENIGRLSVDSLDITISSKEGEGKCPSLPQRYRIYTTVIYFLNIIISAGATAWIEEGLAGRW